MQEKRHSLREFISRDKKNIIFVTDAKQIDDTKQNIKFVGQDWCGYSQLGAAQFNTVCNELPHDEKCYLFDLGNPDSKKAAEKLDLLPEAYPNHVVIGKDGSRKEFLGMLKAPELREHLRASGFKL